MKLRILNNSVRLRLTKTEVDSVSSAGVVRGQTQFLGGGSFDYVLESSTVAAEPAASFSHDALTVTIPAGTLRAWVESELVSISSVQKTGVDSDLKILIEKDFACLSPRDGEDEADMFQHPGEGSCS